MTLSNVLILHNVTVDAGETWQDGLPQWMEQQLSISVYRANGRYVLHCPGSILVASVVSLLFFFSRLLWQLCSDSMTDDVQSLLAQSKVFWESPRAFPESSRHPAFEKGRAMHCLLSWQRWGSHSVDTTFKTTPHRFALRSFMTKSCAAIHPHMCSSNI